MESPANICNYKAFLTLIAFFCENIKNAKVYTTLRGPPQLLKHSSANRSPPFSSWWSISKVVDNVLSLLQHSYQEVWNALIKQSSNIRALKECPIFNILLVCRWYIKTIGVSINISTVFTRFVPHPRIVPHCGTIQRVLSLFLEIMLIAPHPRILLHHIFVNTY